MDNLELQFLNALYSGVLDTASFKTALQLAQKMFNCSAAALVSLDTQAPALDISATSGIFDEYGRLYLEQFAQIDPAPALFSRLATGKANSTDRMFSREQFRADPFVNEFFRPIGLVETLGGTLFSDDARFSLIGLQRGKDRKQFDDDDIARLERLLPHITRALQLRRSFLRAEITNLGLRAALDRLPAGVVLLEADGPAMFVNAAMLTLARQTDGLSLDRSGRPLPTNQGARRRLEEMLRDVAGGGAGGVVTVKRPSGARDYVMLIAAAPSSVELLQWRQAGNSAIVLVHDPVAQPQSTANILEAGLHLTKGSARLLAALAAEDDLKSYAEREGVTIHTARFHLRTAMARTGTRTQAELVRLAVRLLRDFALAGGHGNSR